LKNSIVMSDKTILDVKNLSVDFDGEKIIDNLNFEVNEGETLIILGPNGAGKTVLLKTLLNLLPYHGAVKWANGVKIGYVPQGLPLFALRELPLSVEEFFAFKKVGKSEAVIAMASVGIYDSAILKKRIGLLSSGQFQRILVGWGLIGNSDVLLFDEPTSGIDIGGEETIYNLLDKLKKERNLTVFLVTHDLNIVYREATKVLCLNKQKLCYGLPKEVLTSENLARLFGENVGFYEHHHE